MEPNVSFSELFNKFRHKANFHTYSQFGQALAAEGFVFEDSIFSKWKQGKRFPHDRRVILAIIKVLVRGKGITHLDDANAMLASVEQRDLSHTEKQQILEGLVSENQVYSYYTPTVRPSLILQNIEVNAHSTYVLNLQDITYPKIRNYWQYQTLCAVSENYTALCEKAISSEEAFKMQVEDDYDKIGYGTTLVVVVIDKNVGREYLAATGRFTKGKNLHSVTLDLMNFLNVKGKWPHEEKNCPPELTAEFDRIYIANWAWSWRKQLFRQLLDSVAELVKWNNTKFLYSITAPSLHVLYQENEIQFEKIQDVYFLGNLPEAAVLFPSAYFEATHFKEWWNAYTGLYRLML